MSLPYSSIVAISATVQSPAFAVEKQHMLLAVTSPLIPTTSAALEFLNAAAFAQYFGTAVAEYPQVVKYFGRLSKTGIAPEKLIVARWYKEAAAPFVKGTSAVADMATLKTVDNGSFKITFGANSLDVVLNLTTANAYSDVAALIQTALTANSAGGEAFTGATVVYNTVTGGFIITGGETGSTATVSAIAAGETGTDVSEMLGLVNAEISQGADAETFAEFCDRIYHANTAGFSITTIEPLEQADIEAAAEWLQTVTNGQTYNTAVRLVFNIPDIDDAKAVAAALREKNYTGFVLCYDPNGEYVNVLDCAICAAIDYDAVNGTINFNFQPADGYTPITTLGTVTDYQSGQTNLSLAEGLDALCISYVYSVGFGSQEVVYYGKGLMSGAFGNESEQTNEAWLEKQIQTAIINGLDAVNKLPLQGEDADKALSAWLNTPFEDSITNGMTARGGTLTDADKVLIVQATGNSAAVDAVEANGYYYQILPVNRDDRTNTRRRVVTCRLTAGVVNQVRITNNIYGV